MEYCDCYSNICIQSIPNGSPAFAIPSLDKIDPERLQSDIPKWLQWLTEQSQSEWREFLSTNLQEMTAVPTMESHWLMDRLQIQLAPPENSAEENHPVTQQDVQEHCEVREARL